MLWSSKMSKLDAMVCVEDFLEKDAQKMIPKKRKIADLIKISNDVYELMDDLVPKFQRPDEPSCSFWTNTQNIVTIYDNEEEEDAGANKKVMDSEEDHGANKVIDREEDDGVNMVMDREEDDGVNMVMDTEEDDGANKKVMNSEEDNGHDGANKKVMDVNLETMSEHNNIQGQHNLVDMNISDKSNYGAQKKVIHVEVQTMSNEQPEVERVEMIENECIGRGKKPAVTSDSGNLVKVRTDAGHTTSTTFEATSSSNYENEKVVFKALPEQYKVPHNFKSLSQLTPSQHLENIIGVVTDFQPPAKSKGSDLYMKLFIMDPTYHESAREILYFREDKWAFPAVYCIGDIVSFHRIKSHCYCGNLQIMSNYSTAFMVFPGISNDAVSLETARYISSKPSMLKCHDVKVVEQLRKWVQLNTHILQPNVLVTLAEVQDKGYHTVAGKVVQAKRCHNHDYQWSLTIYDGTKPQPESHQPNDKLPQRKSNPPPESTTVPEGSGHILWDISGSHVKGKLIHVYLGRKPARTVWDFHVKPGDVLLFHYVWAEFDGAILNLFMANSGHSKCGITFINPRSALGSKILLI